MFHAPCSKKLPTIHDATLLHTAVVCNHIHPNSSIWCEQFVCTPVLGHCTGIQYAPKDSDRFYYVHMQPDVLTSSAMVLGLKNCMQLWKCARQWFACRRNACMLSHHAVSSLKDNFCSSVMGARSICLFLPLYALHPSYCKYIHIYY